MQSINQEVARESVFRPVRGIQRQWIEWLISNPLVAHGACKTWTHWHLTQTPAYTFTASTPTHTFTPLCMSSTNYKAESLDCQRTCSWPLWQFDLLSLSLSAQLASVCTCEREKMCMKSLCQNSVASPQVIHHPRALMQGPKFPLVLSINRQTCTLPLAVVKLWSKGH